MVRWGRSGNLASSTAAIRLRRKEAEDVRWQIESWCGRRNRTWHASRATAGGRVSCGAIDGETVRCGSSASPDARPSSPPPLPLQRRHGSRRTGSAAARFDSRQSPGAQVTMPIRARSSGRTQTPSVSRASDRRRLASSWSLADPGRSHSCLRARSCRASNDSAVVGSRSARRTSGNRPRAMQQRHDVRQCRQGDPRLAVDGRPVQPSDRGHRTFTHDRDTHPADGRLERIEERPHILDVVADVGDEADVGAQRVEDLRVRRPAGRRPAALDDVHVLDAGRRHARSERVQHRRRRVDRDHPSGQARDGQRVATASGTNVQPCIPRPRHRLQDATDRVRGDGGVEAEPMGGRAVVVGGVGDLPAPVGLRALSDDASGPRGQGLGSAGTQGIGHGRAGQRHAASVRYRSWMLPSTRTRSSPSWTCDRTPRAATTRRRGAPMPRPVSGRRARPSTSCCGPANGPSGTGSTRRRPGTSTRARPSNCPSRRVTAGRPRPAIDWASTLPAASDPRSWCPPVTGRRPGAWATGRSSAARCRRGSGSRDSSWRHRAGSRESRTGQRGVVRLISRDGVVARGDRVPPTGRRWRAGRAAAPARRPAGPPAGRPRRAPRAWPGPRPVDSRSSPADVVRPTRSGPRPASDAAYRRAPDAHLIACPAPPCGHPRHPRSGRTSAGTRAHSRQSSGEWMRSNR